MRPRTSRRGLRRGAARLGFGPLLAAAVTCLAGTSAKAAPFTVITEPQAGFPNTAVDDSGNAHVVWSSGSGAPELRYCIVRPSGSGCDPATVKTLAPDVTGNGSPHVFVTAPGRVVVSANMPEQQGFGQQVWAWQSSDGGATFGPGAAIMPVVPGQGRGFADAALGPGDALSILDEVPGGLGSPMYVRGPLTGPPAARTADLGSKIAGTARSTSGEQVAVLGGSPVVVSLDGGRLQYAYYGGSGDHNDPAAWVGPVELHPSGTGLGLAAMVAGGPKGLVLVYEINSVQGSDDAFVARKLDPTTFRFAAPVTLGISNDPVLLDVYANPATGAFHAIYQDNSRPTKVRWVASADGITWTRLQPVGDYPSGFRFQMAVNGAASGLLVWDDGDSVRAMRMIPAAEEPAAPPPFAGSLRPVTVSDSRASYTFTVPRSCVLPGQSFKATLKWRRKKRKGNLFVKVRRADFFIGATRVKIDRRAPFRQTLTVKVTQPKGSSITVRARAFIKVKRGKPPTKSIRARVRVCS